MFDCQVIKSNEQNQPSVATCALTTATTSTTVTQPSSSLKSKPAAVGRRVCSAPVCSYQSFAVLVTGPLMGEYCFACWRLSASSVVVCNAAGGLVGGPPRTWAVGRPTQHGGPVWLCRVRATLCF